MGRFAEDMGRLRDEIETSRLARRTFIAETREQVEASAHAFIEDLRGNVLALQDGFRATRAEMAEIGRNERNAFIARLGAAVADIRGAAADRQAEVRVELAECAAADRAERARTLEQLREDVDRMQDGCRRARMDMSAEMRAAGESFRAGVLGAVHDLRSRTLQMVGELAQERGAARMAWRWEVPVAAAPPEPSAPPAPRAKARSKPQERAQPKSQAEPEPQAQPEASLDG